MTQSNDELAAFLKERTLFKVLEERVLRGIARLFQEIQCGPGHIVFRQGDNTDALYIIQDGSVEVIQGDSPPKVLAYLTIGDCFGEMGLLHDTTRSATVRVPEEARILKLPAEAFKELQQYFPEVTKEVTSIINSRLSGKQPLNSPGLQGNLAFFDLPTVIQTVVSSRQTGSVSLRSRGGKLVAQVFLRQGKVIFASFGHLTGEPAIYELLTRNEPLDFIFEPQRESEISAHIDKALSSREPTMILIEGARRADELPKLMQGLNWPASIYKRKTNQPNWTALPQELSAIGHKLWLLLEVGLTTQQLTDKVTCDRYTVLSALDTMHKSGLIHSGISSEVSIAALAHNPSRVALLINALNDVCLNLGVILGKGKMRQLLEEALKISTTRYTNLSSMRVHPETTTLDLRLAKPDVSQSQASEKALEDLTYTLLKLAADRGPQP